MQTAGAVRLILSFCLVFTCPVMSFAFEASDLSSCQGNPPLCARGIPNPEVNDHARLMEVEVVRKLRVKRVFFGTNRKLVQNSDDHQLYKISRFFSDEISDSVINGVVEETVNEKNGKIVLNSAYINFFSLEADAPEYISRHFSSENHRYFLYVHGVNNDFQSSIIDSAKISGISTNDIIPFVFSWPSHIWGISDTVLTRGYDRDKSKNEESIPSFVKYLNYVRFSTYGRVDVFAHSRGSYLVSRVIERLISSKSLNDIVYSVTFAAPDIDSIIFYDLLSRVISDMNYHFTIYVNDGDRVLSASQWKNYCVEIQNSLLREKLGLMDVIDVDGAGSVTGHDFYTRNANIALDFREWLVSRIGAFRRPLLTRTEDFRYRLKKP